MLSQNQPYNGLSLVYFRLFLGITALTTELYFNVSFLSQGVSGAAFWGAISFAIITDAVKILFAGDVSFYRAIGKPDNALFSFCLVAVLIGLSILASLWFLTANPLKNDVALSTVTTRVEQLNASIETQKQSLAKCPAGYISKCVQPQTEQLQKLESELAEAMTAQSAFNETLASQKFWQMLGNATGAKPENLQLGLSLLRSVILELIGVVLCGQFFGNERLKHYAQTQLNNGFKQNSNAPVVTLPSNDNAALQAEIAQLKAELERTKSLEKKD